VNGARKLNRFNAATTLTAVMPGLVPGIHALAPK
jgi:hypothetical protein